MWITPELFVQSCFLTSTTAPRRKLPVPPTMGRHEAVFGGEEGDRTLDLRRAKAVLSHLSYFPVVRAYPLYLYDASASKVLSRAYMVGNNDSLYFFRGLLRAT